MNSAAIVLSGSHVRLEPLDRRHVEPLIAAGAGAGDLYAWSFVPQGEAQMRRYVADALALAVQGRAVPFATIRQHDDTVVGATRFFNLERWAWPADHPAGTSAYDTCEIGYTWLAPDAIRTAANTEAKFLMLTHAFETWRVRAVAFHTDARNTRSRAAIERLGARFEGLLRAHRLAVDYTPRDSARYSIVAAEWPAVKDRMLGLL
ncbi:MAG TPA: GNAT family protein [Candidatus Baltobacteraceae bacterium]|nr:GNAT family protein [Candidatus Baltobacteraceae bacterium]